MGGGGSHFIFETWLVEVYFYVMCWTTVAGNYKMKITARYDDPGACAHSYQPRCRPSWAWQFAWCCRQPQGRSIAKYSKISQIFIDHYDTIAGYCKILQNIAKYRRNIAEIYRLQNIAKYSKISQIFTDRCRILQNIGQRSINTQKLRILNGNF